MTKKTFCVKKPFLAKNAIFSKKKCSKQFLCVVNPSPNMSKHISRNRGATIKASQKTAHDKVFLNFILGQKGHFARLQNKQLFICLSL